MEMQRKVKCEVDIGGHLALLNEQGYCGGKRPVEMWWHTLMNGRESEGETGEWNG